MSVNVPSENATPREQPQADHTARDKQFAELKAEFDQLKALYDVANIGIGGDGGHVSAHKQEYTNNLLEPSIVRSLPDIPILNLGKDEGVVGAANSQAETKAIREEPQILNAWDDEIDLDEELLGLDNVDGDAVTIGQGLITAAQE